MFPPLNLAAGVFSRGALFSEGTWNVERPSSDFCMTNIGLRFGNTERPK